MTNTTLTINVDELLQNDTGRSLTVVAVGDPKYGGTLTYAGNEIVYNMIGNTLGVDEFTYTVRDIHGREKRANVRITIETVRPVVANDDTLNLTIPCGTSMTLSQSEILGNDLGSSTLRITAVNAPVNGSATLNDDGTITFTTAPCDVLKINRSFIVPLRFVKSTLDGNGNAVAGGLYSDSGNISTLKPGDYALLSAIRMGSSVIEDGWTLLADSSQARLFYRVLDQAYIDRHKSQTYAGVNASFYPYFKQLATDRMSKPMVRVDTYSVPASIDRNDVILMTYANTHLSSNTWTFNPPGFQEDYFRSVLIDIFGPGGVDGTTTNYPSVQVYTTRRSNEDNLNNRQAEYVGNRYTLDIQGDTMGYRNGGGGLTSFSENGFAGNLECAFTVAYALRSVPRANVTVDAGFTYRVEDERGSGDTARVIAKAKPVIAKNVTRISYTGLFINEDGFVGMNNMTPGNIQMGVHFKSREDYSNVDPNFPSSYNNPIDPLPNMGWNVVAKTPPNVGAAGTMVQKVIASTANNASINEINAFRRMAGLIAPASMTGVEIFADEGETWEDIFVSCHTFADTISVNKYPYVVPTVIIPEGCQCLYFNTVRPHTAQFTISGGDAFLYHYSRRDFVNLATFMTHATEGPVSISIKPGNSRATMDIGTFALILKNRKT